MKITVEISFSFKRELGPAPLIFDLPARADVLVALHRLAERYPQIEPRLFNTNGEVHRHINALINGGNVSFRQGFQTPLKDGDRLIILPPVGGG